MPRSKNHQPIKKEDLISEAISKFPEAALYLIEYGLACVGCGAAGFETIEEGAKVHGMTNKQIKKMIDELNKKLKNA